MAVTATCPEIKNVFAADECLENFGGLGVNVYVFDKGDLKAPLKAEKNIYPALTTESFNTGKGLYKFESKRAVRDILLRALAVEKASNSSLTMCLRV